MFSSDQLSEIKSNIREINKLKTVEERLEKFIDYRGKVQVAINDELDELFSTVNLKKGKEED